LSFSLRGKKNFIYLSILDEVMSLKDWFNSKPQWLRWGLKGWLITLIGIWLIFIIGSYFDDWGTFRCGLFESQPCNFYQFITYVFYWIQNIILSFIGFILGSIIGKIKSKK